MVVDSFGLRRWFDMKSYMKLCNHNKEIRRGKDGYDPTEKYHKVWDVSITNLNQFIQRGGLDLAINEITWANGLYADIQHRLRGKKVNKGGQHTMTVDAQSRYVYRCTPRNNRFTRTALFNAEGPAKVKRLVEILNPLVIREDKEEENGRRQIFPEKMCLGFDNHFSGNTVSQYLGERNYKTAFTCQHDCLPKECKKIASTMIGCSNLVIRERSFTSTAFTWWKLSLLHSFGRRSHRQVKTTL